MAKSFLLVLSVVLLFQLNAQHVFYGERDTSTYHAGVYFDCAGWMYPDAFISEQEMIVAGAQLQLFYQKFPKRLKELCMQYRVKESNDVSITTIALNDSIVAHNIRKVDVLRNQYTRLDVLVHGYRKPFVPTPGGRTSVLDYVSFRENIQVHQKRATAFLEVYWDGMYGCCFSWDPRKNKPLFDIFVEAQRNAESTGIGLRKILTGCAFDTLNVYSHSLGAKVVMFALTNVQESDVQTPYLKRVNIALIAPAVSEKILDTYRNRAAPGVKFKENYRLAILYNDKDFVLRKKDGVIGVFGPGPLRYGRTTLGCDFRDEVDDVADRFRKEFKGSPLYCFNMHDVGKCHHVYCYTQNDKFASVVDWVENK